MTRFDDTGFGEIDADLPAGSDDRPDHDPNLPPEFTEGRAGFKRLFEMFIEAFPDLSLHNEHMVAEGDLVTRLMRLRRTPETNPAVLVDYRHDATALFAPA